jgi:glucuronoarabinoxylan endo-1,4-beta-xylanase
MTNMHYNKIDNQVTTKTSFGTAYKLSGKTITFDSSHPLISSNKTNTNGYLNLDNQYNQLVLHVDKVTSAASYISSTTILYYINSAGNVNSKNYGTITLNQNGNFDWILDISRNVLTDGCTGILGITNSNAISILTITLGDVYFRFNTEGMYKFSGVYSKGDSFYLDCIENSLTTLLDFTTTTSVDPSQNWNLFAANQNCIFLVDPALANTNTNVVAGTSCSTLSLADTAGSFYTPFNFNATTASLSSTIDKYGVLVLPFESTVPISIKAYTLQATANEVLCNQITDNKIPANTPVLIKGTGTFVFNGTGTVSTPQALKVNNMNLVYISTKVPTGNYSLKTVAGVPAFYKAVSGSEPTMNSFSAYLSPSITPVVAPLPLKFNDSTGINDITSDVEKGRDNNIYDFLGHRIYKPKKGQVYIQGGKKKVF